MRSIIRLQLILLFFLISSSMLTAQIFNNQSKSVKGSLKSPENFHLYQNHPNPFNPVTTFKFEINKESNVRLRIFNLLGEEVAVIVNDIMQPGTYEYKWDASSFNSGFYLYRFESGGNAIVKKLLLLK